MMKRALSYTLVAALLCLGGLFMSAWGENSARIVRLSLVDGNVQLDRADGEGLQHAIVNTPLVQGAEIRTGDDGYAEVEFERGSTVRLAPNSVLQIDQLGRSDHGDETTALQVKGGTVYFDLQKKEADTFHIAAAQQQITIPKEAHFRVEASGQTGEIAVFKGNVDVAGEGKTSKLKKDQTLRFDLNQGSPYQLAEGISTVASDGWDEQRDQYRDQYSFRNSNYNGYSSSYVYGLSDLSYWGNYNFIPGWGWMWRPFDASFGWDPFSSGAWMYYPGWGWTWVSAYPWGWTPYYYGNWVMVPNYGWYWQPGRSWSNWHPIPPATNPSTGTGVSIVPKPPVGPPKHGGGVILVNTGGTTWRDRTPGGRPTMGLGKPGGMPPGQPGTPAVHPGTGSRTQGGTPTVKPANPTRPAAPPQMTPREQPVPRQNTPPSPPPRMDSPRTWTPAPRAESPRTWSPPPPPPSNPKQK